MRGLCRYREGRAGGEVTSTGPCKRAGVDLAQSAQASAKLNLPIPRLLLAQFGTERMQLSVFASAVLRM